MAAYDLPGGLCAGRCCVQACPSHVQVSSNPLPELEMPPPKRTITRRSTSNAKVALARGGGALASKRAAAHDWGKGAASPVGASEPEPWAPAAGGGTPQAAMANRAAIRAPVFSRPPPYNSPEPVTRT